MSEKLWSTEKTNVVHIAQHQRGWVCEITRVVISLTEQYFRDNITYIPHVSRASLRNISISTLFCSSSSPRELFSMLIFYLLSFLEKKNDVAWPYDWKILFTYLALTELMKKTFDVRWHAENLRLNLSKSNFPHVSEHETVVRKNCHIKIS